MASKSKTIKGVKSLLKYFYENHFLEIEKLDPTVTSLLEATAEIDNSWSGSFAGSHAFFYYKDFERPQSEDIFDSEWGMIHGVPSGWSEKSKDEILKKLEELTSLEIKALEKLEDQYNSYAKVFEDLKKQIILELEGLNQSNKLVEEIEGFQFGRKPSEIAGDLFPGIRTRDSRAINQGIGIPVHFYYKTIGLALKELMNSYEEFDHLLERICLKIKKLPRLNSFETTNYWNYANPFWLLWNILKFCFSHKILSFILLILSYLAIDYSRVVDTIELLLSLF